MSSPSFVAYIDESGDEGFRFGAGSSMWFILSAAITRKASDLATVKLVDRVRMILNKPPRKPLHFRRLKHEHRLPFVREVAGSSIRAVSVLVHKPSLKEPEKFQQPHVLYFYTVRYLLERVSWYCRDHRTRHDPGDGSARIVFSNRSGMPYEEMREYLRRLERHTGLFDVRVVWSVIKADEIRSMTPGRSMGLQIADALAGSCFYAVEPSAYGFTEPRYMELLRPVYYQHRGRFRGYGLKFWPREVDELVDSDPNLKWTDAWYK